MFTMGQAAKEAGVSKTTINRAIKSGRLSAEKLDDGSYRINAAELFRVFPPNSYSNSNYPLPNDVTPNVTGNHIDVTSTDWRIKELELQNAHLERENANLRKQMEAIERARIEWKEQADKWEKQAEVVKVISDLRKPTGFWAKFRRS